jgi:hypothetical protein
MKNTTIALLSLIAMTALGISAFSSKGEITKFHGNQVLNTGGSPSARTGAPGETTCTGCHTGSVVDGNAGINVLELSTGGNEYVPDDMNTLQLTFTEASNKNGFQLVVLNAAEEMAGSLVVTDAVNTKFVTSAILSREYVTHTAAGTSLNTWSFDWLAPATGGDVTFYVATNKTNSNSQNSGDVVYVSEHNFTAPDLADIAEEKEVSNNLTVGFQPGTNQLVLDFEVNGLNELSLNVTDLSGRSVYFKNMGIYTPGNYSDKVLLHKLETGIYNVTLFMNNKPYSGKVFVQ